MRLHAAALIILALAAGGATAALGHECHVKPVHAKGGASILEAAARSRARAAWIKKVRGKKALGRDYAAWLQARGRTYTCHKNGRRMACTASAIPCRPDPATDK